MSFARLLHEIVDHCGGAVGAALMGMDGVAIEQVLVRPAPEGPLREDIGTAGIEFGRILHEIRKAADSLAGGALLETTVRLARFQLVFCPVDQDTFLAVVLEPDGNLGKARYLIRRHLLAIRQEL
jgi:predicted regulator of Ras-like GTPase activity (Roadblock/LC7/MglB family)